MNLHKTLLIIITVLSVSACSTIQTAKKAQGTGEKMSFSVNEEEIWPILLNSVSATDGTIKEQDKESCTILASYGVTAWSWGEKVGVFCKPNGNGTEVEVVTKASLKTNITAVKRAPQIFKAISESIN